jgi:hypothetical protein
MSTFGPVTFVPWHWPGNLWPSIEIEPEDAGLFPRLLTHLCLAYDVPPPAVVDTIDGWACDFRLLDVEAKFMIDTWSFSLAFVEEATRDRVLDDLRSLPAGYFDDHE